MTAGKAWPEADKLFRRDALWVGGDGAYSFQLDDDRVLWVFADSFIGARPGEPRGPGAVMVNNTVGVQQGLDPRTATMRFFWRTKSDGRPASFFTVEGGGYLWPCNGSFVDGRLVLFAMRVRARPMTDAERESSAALSSFDVYGWVAIVVDDPAASPDTWNLRYIEHVETRFATTLGAGAVFVDGDHVYTHGASRRAREEQYLARWPLAEVAEARLADPEWWYGDAVGWARDLGDDRWPATTVDRPQSEFTVHRDRVDGKLVWVQTSGIFGADIEVRTATRPEGPWSSFVPVFHPAEGDADGGFVYGAKAHPEQLGAGDDLVLTYNNNSLRPGTLMERPELYFPTFVRVPRR